MSFSLIISYCILYPLISSAPFSFTFLSSPQISTKVILCAHQQHQHQPLHSLTGVIINITVEESWCWWRWLFTSSPSFFRYIFKGTSTFYYFLSRVKMERFITSEIRFIQPHQMWSWSFVLLMMNSSLLINGKIGELKVKVSWWWCWLLWWWWSWKWWGWWLLIL